MSLTKKWIIFVCAALCLSGCSSRTEPTQQALDFRTSLMEAGGSSFTAEILADYGERAYSFTMTGETQDGQTRLEVLEPESIAGIAAEVSSDGTELVFGGAELDFGQLANGLVSPVTTPWLLSQCWESAYIAYAGADGEQERVTYLRGYGDEELAVDTWFLNGTPTYAEVAYDGTKCLSVAISDFQFCEN